MKRIRRRELLKQAAVRTGAAALAAGAVAAPSLLFSSTARAASSSPVGRDATFVVVDGTEPNSLDPAVGTGPFQAIVNAMFEGLVQWNDKGQIQPALATSWTSSGGGRIWTFTLRSGVRFHDGTPFGADAVKATIGHILDRNTPATRRGNYLLIKDVLTPDEHTVRFVTDPPNPDFPLLMADGSAKIVSPAALKTYGQDFGRHPVGTGPFVFEEWVPNDHVSASLNATYWGPSPRVRRFLYRPIPESAARVVVLKTGEADVVQDLPPTDMDALRRESGLVVYATPAQTIAELEPADTKPPLKDVRVRRALNMAIDKNAIIQGIMKGFAKPLSSPGIPGLWGSFDFTPVAYDPNQARQLLAAAGYGGGMDLTINITAGRWAGDLQVVQAVQGYWANLGVRTTVHQMDFATLLAGSSSDPDARPGAMTSLLKSSPYIDYHLYRMYDSAATNVPGTQQRTGYANPEVDRLLDEERSMFDQAKRLPILKHAQALVWQDQPLIYLFQLVNLWGARAGAKGFVVLPSGDFVPGVLRRT
ncbi:MAG TPA: ABC transporter substrate-binding protein [bacterium]|nr:ABC transporter substrate-binding protein [bacterium]